jgi:hypothetical protein
MMALTTLKDVYRVKSVYLVKSVYRVKNVYRVKVPVGAVLVER